MMLATAILAFGSISLHSVGIWSAHAQDRKPFEVKVPNFVAKITMTPIEGGTVTVGGQKVTIKPMYVSTTEVPWEMYDIFAFRLDLTQHEQATGVDAKSRPSKPYGAPDRGFGHNGWPALGITYNAADKFCAWLSAKTGKTFRLPTEAEWEYFARAGATADPTDLDDVAWFWDNAADEAHPVGKKKPNAWGLFDVLGNVSEWAMDPKGVPVTCGGSYMDKQDKISFKGREYYNPKWQQDDAHTPKSVWWFSNGPQVGFRVVSEG